MGKVWNWTFFSFDFFQPEFPWVNFVEGLFLSRDKMGFLRWTVNVALLLVSVQNSLAHPQQEEPQQQQSRNVAQKMSQSGGAGNFERNPMQQPNFERNGPQPGEPRQPAPFAGQNGAKLGNINGKIQPSLHFQQKENL